jgi:hypothetical protein
MLATIVQKGGLMKKKYFLVLAVLAVSACSRQLPLQVASYEGTWRSEDRAVC